MFGVFLQKGGVFHSFLYVCTKKLTLKDFALPPIEDTEYSVGSRKVMTNIFGKHPVYAVVTSTKLGSEKLFICTKFPDKLHFDFSSGLGKVSLFAKSNISFLPLTVYSLRRHIETAYYEQKKFWSLGSCILRSKIGIERLTNLITVLYAFMTLLPFYDNTFKLFYDNTFKLLSHHSPQQSRFVIGISVWHDLFFVTFDTFDTPTKNTFSFVMLIHSLIL